MNPRRWMSFKACGAFERTNSEKSGRANFSTSLPSPSVSARVDGATPWQSFWHVTFPLMLPVSITAIMIRIIFKLKLADIIINVTSGGPGGATDSVTSFIFREYRDRSNVGYGTLLAMVYLVIIVIFMMILLKLSDRLVKRMTGAG